MNIAQPELLRVLVAFAEAKNLVAAAETLRISQPAVTQRLQRLQEQLPMPLYDFVGRKKVLTHYGQAIYQLAKENLAQLEMGLENIHRRYAKGTNLVLRLGCRKEFFEVFAQTIHFSGRIEYNQMSDEAALNALDKDLIDVAITDKVINTADLISKKIFEGASHFIFQRKIFPSCNSFRDIQKNRELLIEKPCVMNKIETFYFERLAQNLKINSSQFLCKALLEDWNSLVSLVEQGAGYSIIPAFVSTHQKELGVFEVPHSIIPRVNYHVTFHRKLKKVDAFNKALSFAIHSS